jgi:hypothetical protein
VKGKNAGHVILIIGHTIDDTGKRRYVVYDDSGAFLRKLKIDSFIGIVDFPSIIKNCIFILYPEYEKIYIDVVKLINLYNYDNGFKETRNILGKINRAFFVDTCLFKRFIHKFKEKEELPVFTLFKKTSKQEELKKEVDSFLLKDKPHFILVLEFLHREEKKVLYLPIDSTRDVRHFLDFKRAVLSPIFVISLKSELEKEVFHCLKPIDH